MVRAVCLFVCLFVFCSPHAGLISGYLFPVQMSSVRAQFTAPSGGFLALLLIIVGMAS